MEDHRPHNQRQGVKPLFSFELLPPVKGKASPDIHDAIESINGV